MAEFWWDPASHARRRPYLLARNRMNAALRRLFERYLDRSEGDDRREPG